MRLMLEGVWKSFPGVLALRDVSFRLREGEIHALLGENGAGKSTLVQIIAGLCQPDSGRIQIDGRPVAFASPRDAIAAGVSAVQQDRNLIPRSSIGENILLERLPTRRGLVDVDQVHRKAKALLEKLNLEIDTRAEARTLSVAQMQIVEIAKALSQDARILLLDEPTASITERETKALFAILRQLRGRGVAVLFVSHRLEDIFEIADRVTVLRDGRNAATGEPIVGMSRAALVSLMVGGAERVAPTRARATDEGRVALQAIGLTTESGHKDVSFALHRGEILGLYGLVGSGRSELARALVGAGKITGGKVFVNGESARISGMSDALDRYRIGFISEDRKHEGLILGHSIQRNVAITVWRRLAGRLGLITDGMERRVVEPITTKLNVSTPSLQQNVETLSGGNQQKISIAKWLAASVEILIVDEPTAGIDINTKGYVHELLTEIASSGVSVLLISSDLSETVTLADRILIMHQYRIVGETISDHQYEKVRETIMTKIYQIDALA